MALADPGLSSTDGRGRVAAWRARLFPRANRSSQPLRVEQLSTVEAILSAARELGPEASPTAFQSLVWLTATYRHLVPACGGTPLGLLVRDPVASTPVALFPLYVRREGRLLVARFADCSVADYNAPLHNDALCNTASASGLITALKASLTGVDVLAFDRLSRLPSQRLSQHPMATPCHLSGHTLTLIGTVDDFVAARGKKYRKEVERCRRVLASEGAWSFGPARTPDDIAAAFAALDRQQADRHADKGDGYALAAPQFAAFYLEVLHADPTLGQIFTLTVNGTIIAALFGTLHDGTFTLLRIANGGDAWRHVSPGRLIVIETMRHFQAQGVTTFDMGIGDYAFKRGFGTSPIALVDLVVPISWRGVPHVTALRLKAAVRRNEHALRLVRRLRALSKAGQLMSLP